MRWSDRGVVIMTRNGGPSWQVSPLGKLSHRGQVEGRVGLRFGGYQEGSYCPDKKLSICVDYSVPLLVVSALCVGFWRKMGGDLITTEPHVLKVDKEVRDILEKAGLLAFFRRFSRFSESISVQAAETWEDGKVVVVNSLTFTISNHLIVEVYGLPLEGAVILREKTSQAEQLTKFLTDEETFCWLQSGITRESQPKPNEEKVNIPLFLFKSLQKSVKAVKVGRGKVPLHQGLVKSLYQSAKEKGGALGGLEGGFPRSIGTPISRAQLRLGAAPLGKDSLSSASKPTSNASPPPQVLASSLVKCSRRSSRLQQKSEEKHKIVDYNDTSEENKGRTDDDKDAEIGKVKKKSLCPEPFPEEEVVSKLKEMGSAESHAQLANTSKAKD
eukprot:Gb_18255 [translate_table: standard]